MATAMKAAVHLGPNHTENMEVCKNANFEGIQNLFNVPQRLMMDHPAETLNVSTVGCTSLSWQRSTLRHDQIITWTEAKVHVYGRFRLMFGKDLRTFGSERQQSNSYAELFGIDGEPIEFEWTNFQGRTSLEMLLNAQADLQSRGFEPEEYRDRIIFVSTFNDIAWTKKGNSEKCNSNSNQIKNYAQRFSQGHWTCLGPGDEKKWYGTHCYKPDGKWDSAAPSMVQRFAETGHPIFKGISALSRGILKRKQKRDTIHFNADSSNTELLFRTIHSASQLSIFGAVSNWCEEFGQNPNETETSVKFEKTAQTLKKVRPQGPNPKG